MEQPAENAPREAGVPFSGTADNCFDIGQYKGKVVEVYWTIIKNEDTDVEEATNLWWPGQIADPVKDDAGEPRRTDGGEIIYTINYEERGEFEAEQCQVAFLSPRVLRDMDTGACMAWRIQGDTWEDAAGALKDYADESDGGEEIVSASEFLERQMSELQDATGVATEEEGMQRLEANLPRQTVINGARAMREFTNLFKAHMDKFREQGGDVVTKEVVDEFVSSLRASRGP